MLEELIALKDENFNEEQTKFALAMPVLQQLLGWNVFSHSQVIPEFTADITGKKGEKIDFALDLEGDGKPEVLIELKRLGDRLDKASAAQLARYFSVTDAKIGILTDGYEWRLFTDLDKTNIMDDEPFLSFNLKLLQESDVVMGLFMRLSFNNFDVDRLRSWAEVYRDTQRLRSLVQRELKKPSIELVKFFWSQLNPNKRLTTAREDEFRSSLEKVLTRDDSILDKHLGDLAKSFQTRLLDEIAIPNKHRKGYFTDNQGHKGPDGNLKHSWVEYWREVAADPLYLSKIYELAKDDKYKNVFNFEEKSSSDKILNHEISPGLYVQSNLSSERRELLFEETTKALQLNGEIVYSE